MASKLDIPLYGPSVNIVRRCGLPLSDILQSKFGCVATIDGVDFERDPSSAQQRRPTVNPEKRFVGTLHGGVQVSVWKADLTTFRVDAVVNAANEHLSHYGGLALALSKAGGPKIQQESDDYVNRHGLLKTGDALVFDAGSLPCNKIIHAVGPWLPRFPPNHDVKAAEPLLRRAIKSILDKVEEHRLQSVAIPAISSGLFNYPVQECANTIVTTVKHYYESPSSRPLPKEIFLVNNDEPTVKEMERACHEILSKSKSSRGGTKTQPLSTSSVQLGNVLLTLKKGNIEDEKTDVIVNTASPQKNLKEGEISKALLHKAGNGMQHELYNVPQSGCVSITKSYNLQCKQVYHTFCPIKGRDPAAQQILSESVKECVWLAATNHHKSISFPAIGTGALGFSRQEVAQIMSEAVVDFAQNVPMKMEVYFVIFPKDNETFKTFEEQMGHLQRKASHLRFAAFEPREDSPGNSAPTPQITLNGSEETTREAERWLSDLLFKFSGTVVIRNNFIQHFGEQEHQQLSRLTKKGVAIEEFLENGHAGITVNGGSHEDVVLAGLQVEAMLCTVQKEFVTEEEVAMINAVLTKNVSFERKMVDNTSQEFKDRLSAFKKHGLWILKVDKVENPILKILYDLKKTQLCCSTPPRKMLQRIPAQFCEMVSHIGFHAEYAPPDDAAYGEGMYFAANVRKALEVWKEQKDQKEEYLYFVEAQVLTGNSTPGRPDLILPPAVDTDPQVLNDSVSGGPDVNVIFSGYQALPTYIITCKMG